MELVTHRFGKTKELLVLPLGDIQYAGDDREVAMGMLKRHIEWGVSQNAWFLGMGDYTDAFSPSNRQKLVGAGLYDTALKSIDKGAKEMVDELYKRALKPSRGRWLGLLEGHHYHRFQDGTTSDHYLAGLLQAKFLGTSAYVRLVFPRSSEAGSHGEVLVWCHHGAGSSTAVGGPINRIARVAAGFEADIYIMGHMHSKDAKTMDYIHPVFPSTGEPRLVHGTRLFAVSGSFLKGFIPGRKGGAGMPEGNYAEKGMMNPRQLGAPLIKIRPRWSEVGGVQRWSADLGAEL